MINTLQLAKTTMARPVERPGMPRGGMQASTIEKLSQLPPADDAMAEAQTYPQLGLLPEDIERLNALGEAWSEARVEAVAAEQTLVAAQRAAAELEHHKARAGEIAAAAFGKKLNGHGVEAAAGITDKIQFSREAASALPSLARQRDAARVAAGDARAALCSATVDAIRGAIKRGAQRYSLLALELTRTIGALDAAIASLPNGMQSDLVTGWNAHFLNALCVPSLPVELGWHDRGTVELHFRPTLLHVQHPRLSAHNVAAAGWLKQQLVEALAPAGISPRNLLG